MEKLTIKKEKHVYCLSRNGNKITVVPKDVDMVVKTIRQDRKLALMEERIVQYLRESENGQMTPREFQRRFTCYVSEIKLVVERLEKKELAYMKYTNSKGKGRPWQSIVLGKKD